MGAIPILKERLFGLTGNQGNHGEDVKEYYFYLDSTPTHSYMRMLYKYPQAEFPYRSFGGRKSATRPWRAGIRTARHGRFRREPLLRCFRRICQSRRRGHSDQDHGGESRAGSRHAARAADNSGFATPGPGARTCGARSRAKRHQHARESLASRLQHWQYGKRWLLCAGQPELLFTENETNIARLFNGRNRSPYVKDAFHEYLIRGNKAAVNPEQTGTKVAAYYPLQLDPGQSATFKLRLTDIEPSAEWIQFWEWSARSFRLAMPTAPKAFPAPTILAKDSTTCLPCARKKPRNFTPRAFPRISPTTQKP